MQEPNRPSWCKGCDERRSHPLGAGRGDPRRLAPGRGGTCTGEHGIGLGKIDAFAAEHGDLVPLYRIVKRAFDPLGILNPRRCSDNA